MLMCESCSGTLNVTSPILKFRLTMVTNLHKHTADETQTHDFPRSEAKVYTMAHSHSKQMVTSKLLTWKSCHLVNCIRIATHQEIRAASKMFRFLVCHQKHFFHLHLLFTTTTNVQFPVCSFFCPWSLATMWNHPRCGLAPYRAAAA